jgi:hypothetical protein
VIRERSSIHALECSICTRPIPAGDTHYGEQEGVTYTATCLSCHEDELVAAGSRKRFIGFEVAPCLESPPDGRGRSIVESFNTEDGSVYRQPSTAIRGESGTGENHED